MSLKSPSNLETFKYQTNLGWSCTNFPDLDSDNTLVLIFGAKEFVDSPKAILEPASALLFPLSVKLNPDDEKQVVRTVLNINEKENSMTFAGDIPEGALVQLMKVNFDRLIDGTTEAAIMSLKEDDFTGERLCVAISCVGKRLVLGMRSDEELEATLDVLPKNTKQIGFYSYGEISPYASEYCNLHNQTMTLTVIYEY